MSTAKAVTIENHFMLRQDERYAFICETRMYTYRNSFAPPTARETLEDLQGLLGSEETITRSYGNRRFSLVELQVQKDSAHLLFRLSDPNIPDNILENEQDMSLRPSERRKGETPAISAHLVIDISSHHDSTSAYPTAIENVDYISISLIRVFLNDVLAAYFTTKREKTPGGKKLQYSPRIHIAGHQSKTIENVLQKGGVVKGMRFETSVTTDDGFGEGKYSVTKTSGVYLKVDGRPTGNAALDWAQKRYSEWRGHGLKKAKIVIESDSGKTKTAPLDVQRENIGANFFILQEKLDDFGTPLKSCEESIRDEMVTKMKSKMPK